MDYQKAAAAAIAAWQTGELTSSYEAFKGLLADEFLLFSHPFKGTFRGPAARAELLRLVQEREIEKDELHFSDVQFYLNGSTVLVQFDSKGTVANGKLYFDGNNVIAFSFDGEGRLVGFREYLGFIDPKWFSQ